MQQPKFSYSRYQRLHFTQFEEFRQETPRWHCAWCLMQLYPEEVHFISASTYDDLPCQKWNFSPCVDIDSGKVAACKAYKNSRRGLPTFVYPGEPLTVQLNYRERSCLSPIKIMSRVTRKHSSNRTYCGHYEVTGSIWTRHNLEFTQMLYGGSLGIPFIRHMMEGIDQGRVQEVYQQLVETNILLRPYQTAPIAERMQQMFEDAVNSRNRAHPNVNVQWNHQYLLPIADVNPQAGEVGFDDQILGTDVFDNDVNYKDHPAVLALIFPYLFTNGRGYYSFMSTSQSLDERQGGLAQANQDGETLKQYVKSRILMKDRRMGRCTEFLFFMLDMIEKHNIQSANRHVISVQAGVRYTKRSVMINNEFNRQQVSLVPHTIRSSHAYKRRHCLNLQAMFHRLGSPQLFLTISCNDFAPEYCQVCGGDPWNDPVAFTRHFKRSFQKLFNSYILGPSFSNKVGGILDWSWTMEIQDRGSPHIHLVLWTGKTKEQLLAVEDLVVCRLPDEQHDQDLFNLVNTLQIHQCTNYCSRRREETHGEQRPYCRFGFPKQMQSENEFDERTGRTLYKRSAADCWVNRYNPYLLKLMRVSMDIQINNDSKVLLYLAKYLTKSDSDIELKDQSVLWWGTTWEYWLL